MFFTQQGTTNYKIPPQNLNKQRRSKREIDGHTGKIKEYNNLNKWFTSDEQREIYIVPQMSWWEQTRSSCSQSSSHLWDLVPDNTDKSQQSLHLKRFQIRYHLICTLGWRGIVAQLVVLDSRSKDPRSEPCEEHNKNLWEFFQVKKCADSSSVCPTPMCLHMCQERPHTRVKDCVVHVWWITETRKDTCRTE